MNAFTIKDLENLSGIKAHTIRIWEQRYNFLKPQRTGTNIRYYSNDELRVLLNIALLNKHGYKISHINRMEDHEIRERILQLSQEQAQQERIVNELIQHMASLDMDGFEGVLNNYFSEYGIQEAIMGIIFPFLERIGVLWLTGNISPAQEHLVCNIIRQKLIVGIENAYCTQQNENRKTVLLFLPENEHHELGLLFMHYLLKVNGVKVIYVGANIPLKDVENIVQLKQPDIVFTHITSIAGNFNFERYLYQLHQRLQGYQVIVSGRMAQQYKKKVPDNIHFKVSIPQTLQFIQNI